MRHRPLRPLRDLRRRLLKGSAHFPEQDVSRELVAGDRKTAHLSQRASSARQAPSGVLLFWTRHIGSYEPSVHRAGLGLIPGRVAYQARSLVTATASSRARCGGPLEDQQHGGIPVSGIRRNGARHRYKGKIIREIDGNRRVEQVVVVSRNRGGSKGEQRVRARLTELVEADARDPPTLIACAFHSEVPICCVGLPKLPSRVLSPTVFGCGASGGAVQAGIEMSGVVNTASDAKKRWTELPEPDPDRA